MLCDKGKLTAKKPYPCKYYFCRSYASESAGHVVEMFCKDEDIYGFADDMDDLSMIRLNEKSLRSAQVINRKSNAKQRCLQQ